MRAYVAIDRTIAFPSLNNTQVENVIFGSHIRELFM